MVAVVEPIRLTTARAERDETRVYLTTKEAAALVGISPDRLRALCRAGVVPYHEVGQKGSPRPRWTFVRDEVLRAVRREPTPTIDLCAIEEASYRGTLRALRQMFAGLAAQ